MVPTKALRYGLRLIILVTDNANNYVYKMPIKHQIEISNASCL